MINKKIIITGDEPAAPHGAWGQQTGTGLTIRQEIAARAMAGILTSNPEYLHGNIARPIPASVAAEAVTYADALIAELNK